ncbi:MAG: hypothetical protein Ta2B_02480 [Termitinemataceae bacterium]|nr:MAG: hypothetical protein Ta2B_02480 [Termitinemataceae bacterium]
MKTVKNSKLFWYVLLGVGVALFFVNEFAHGATPSSDEVLAAIKSATGGK